MYYMDSNTSAVAPQSSPSRVHWDAKWNLHVDQGCVPNMSLWEGCASFFALHISASSVQTSWNIPSRERISKRLYQCVILFHSDWKRPDLPAKIFSCVCVWDHIDAMGNIYYIFLIFWFVSKKLSLIPLKCEIISMIHCLSYLKLHYNPSCIMHELELILSCIKKYCWFFFSNG